VEETESHEFSDVKLAFEVELKWMEETSMKLNDCFFDRFRETGLYKCHKGFSDRAFHHLVLDLHGKAHHFLTMVTS
jgi:hypothetical protein